MEKLKKNHNLKYIFLVSVLLLILLPVLVNVLMSFSISNVYGETSTWITFFGSYIGSVLSGLLTLSGVFLTIRYTQELNKENIAFTQQENRESIRFTQQENRRNKLPEMIYNLEECLDFLEERREELDKLKERSVEEVILDLHERELKLFYLNDNYQVQKSTIAIRFIKEYVKQIRNYTVKVDTPAYESFLKFKESIALAYSKEVSPVESEFESFRQGLYIDYEITHSHILWTDNSKFTDIELSSSDTTALIIMKTNLFGAEYTYLRLLVDSYKELEEELSILLLDLTKEFSRESLVYDV